MRFVDPNVAAAAALAHDIGHPPFGHVGEEELNDLVTNVYRVPDGFEGNAQSFRVVTKLSQRVSGTVGLNLTRATLDAILKYPWLRDTGNEKKTWKWNVYNSEFDEFKFARALESERSERKSIEAEIMDWADDVTYAVHDLEDFYRAGLVPLERLQCRRDQSERRRFFEGVENLPERIAGGKLSSEREKELFAVICRFPLDQRYIGNGSQRSALRWYVSRLVGDYIDAFSVRIRDGRVYPVIDKQKKCQVDMLKLLTWHYVIYNPFLGAQQFGQRRIIRELFQILHDAASHPTGKYSNLIPVGCREELQEHKGDWSLVTRRVADQISGMSEREAITLYYRVTGIDLGSVLGAFV